MINASPRVMATPPANIREPHQPVPRTCQKDRRSTGTHGDYRTGPLGKILTDLAVTLAPGGDCLADIAVLRSSPDIFGPVASDPTVSRLVSTLAAADPKAVRVIRRVRAAAREHVWKLAGKSAPGADGALIPLDLDATIVIAHSGKEAAAPIWKRTFGFHPLCSFIDHGPGGTGKATVFKRGSGSPERRGAHAARV